MLKKGEWLAIALILITTLVISHYLPKDSGESMSESETYFDMHWPFGLELPPTIKYNPVFDPDQKTKQGTTTGGSTTGGSTQQQTNNGDDELKTYILPDFPNDKITVICDEDYTGAAASPDGKFIVIGLSPEEAAARGIKCDSSYYPLELFFLIQDLVWNQHVLNPDLCIIYHETIHAMRHQAGGARSCIAEQEAARGELTCLETMKHFNCEPPSIQNQGTCNRINQMIKYTTNFIDMQECLCEHPIVTAQTCNDCMAPFLDNLGITNPGHRNKHCEAYCRDFGDPPSGACPPRGPRIKQSQGQQLPPAQE